MWWSLPAAAQSVVDPFQEPDESELFRFEEQLVTVASRYAQTARKAPSTVTVVTAETIRERGYRKVSDLLRDLPGIYVWRTPEGRDVAAIRGVISADDNKLLVLVDGMPWYEGVYTHGFIDDYLPISNVRQVEVIKGPGSAVYGTNAFTGVVNVVTFAGEDLEGGRARWIGGSTGRSDLTVTAGGRLGTADARASAYGRVFGQSGEGLEVTPSRAFDLIGTDPKRGVNVGASFGVAGFDARIHHVDYAHTYLVQPREDPLAALGKTLDTFDLQYHDTFSRLRYRFDFDRFSVTPTVAYHRYDDPASYFLGGEITVDPDTLAATQSFVTVDAEKTTERIGLGVDLEAEPAIDHVVVGGVGYETVRVLRLFDQAFPSDGSDPSLANGFAVYDDCGGVAGLYTNGRGCVPPRLRNLYAHAQYSWTATQWFELTAGVRVDKRLPTNLGEKPSDGAFRLSVSPRVGLLVVPNDRVTAKVLYGRAFRAPNVRETLVRADPDPLTGVYPFTTGNLDLVPESIHTAEAELVGEVTEGLRLRADANGSRLQNEIDKVAPGIYCNLGSELTVVGGEAGAEATTGPVTATADYALTLARYGPSRGGEGLCDIDYGGRIQYEYPPHMLKASLRLAPTDTLSMTVFGEGYGPRPRRVWSPDVQRPDGAAFALLHAAAAATQLGPDGRFSVGATVRNVLGSAWATGVYRDDANYEGNPGALAGEGRSVVVSVEGRL
ncbi:MAG: TonB-dependent receptor [Myxococcota bacterium]